MTHISAFMSGIPYNAERKDENHYKTVLFLIFKLCTPYVVRTEECSAAGRADAVVETADAVYVFEFKLDSTATVLRNIQIHETSRSSKIANMHKQVADRHSCAWIRDSSSIIRKVILNVNCSANRKRVVCSNGHV